MGIQGPTVVARNTRLGSGSGGPSGIGASDVPGPACGKPASAAAQLLGVTTVLLCCLVSAAAGCKDCHRDLSEICPNPGRGYGCNPNAFTSFYGCDDYIVGETVNETAYFEAVTGEHVGTAMRTDYRCKAILHGDVPRCDITCSYTDNLYKPCGAPPDWLEPSLLE